MVEQRSPKPLVAGSIPATPARGKDDDVFRAVSGCNRCAVPSSEAGHNQRLSVGLRVAGNIDCVRAEHTLGTSPNAGMAPALVAS